MQTDVPMRAEISSIFTQALGQRELAVEDRNYAAELVAAKTGLSHSEAERHVADVFQRDQQTVDAARKAAAHSLYWLFVALLLGAFSGSFAATLGGKRRDHIPAQRGMPVNARRED